MVVFPNCKINLGLYVTRKREDGFHDIQTCFYPLNWCDALEVTETQDAEEFSFATSGLPISGQLEDNLIWKCFKAIQKDYALPPLQVHLHKVIPMGAGLGGGSSDAAFFIQLLDRKFNLNISFEKKMELAGGLGSDCPFFLKNTPVLATGRGEIFSDLSVNLDSYYILCVFPAIHSHTGRAFSAIQPKEPANDLSDALTQPVEIWKDLVTNDFEGPVFSQFPILQEIKQSFYKQGAVYAAMSGSGSSIFGLFNSPPDLSLAQNYLYYLQSPQNKVL